MSAPIANQGLAKICRARGVIQKELLHGAGVGRSSLHHWLHGRPSPRLEQRVALFLGVAPQHLRKQVGVKKGA